MSRFCVLTTAVVSVLVPKVGPRVHARRPSDLARGLRHAVEHVDPAAEVDDRHQQDEEDDDDERELDEGLAPLAGIDGARISSSP